MANNTVFESTTSPVPISEYKAKVPPAVTGYVNKLKEMAAAASRKAKLATATVVDKLNNSGIRKLISGVLAARNAIMNTVKGAVAWVASVATMVKSAISDVVQGVKNLADDLANLIKQSAIYKLANSLCGGIDLDSLAADIEAIQTQIDFDKALDYALSSFDSNLFNGIKNCTLFKPGSLDKVKEAVEGMFDSSNIMMLDCMKDKVDYIDVANVDRKLKAAATGMTDDPDNAMAMSTIAEWMGFFTDFLFTTRESRFQGIVLYKPEDIATMKKTVPNYVDSVIDSNTSSLLMAANAVLV